MKRGKASQAVLDRSVLRPLVLSGTAGERAAFGEDCALFALSPDRLSKDMLSSDVLSPDREGSAPHGSAGLACAAVCAPVGGRLDRPVRMLVAEVCNNISTGGAVPEQCMITITYPETEDENGLKELNVSLARALKEAGLKAAGGHTQISGAVSRPVLSITGFGSCVPCQKPSSRMDLVMAGWCAMGGTAILADAFCSQLLERYPRTLVDTARGLGDLAFVSRAAGIGVEHGALAMHDISQGGVFGALWELAERLGAGLELDLRKLPIRQETIEICEFLDINPYLLYGTGGLLLCTPQGEALVMALQEAGIQAALVGHTTDQNARILRNGAETRCLDRPAQDELWHLACRMEKDGKAKSFINEGKTTL